MENERNAFVCELAGQGVATNVHFKPLPMMTAYRNMGFHIEDYPNAYYQYANEITLPMHTCLKNDDVEYVIWKVKDILREYKKCSKAV